MSKWFESFGFAEVYDDLLIGAYPLDASDVALLSEAKTERILNLVQEREYEPGERDEVEEALAEAEIDEYRLELVDHGDLPPDHIELAVLEVAEWLDDGHRVYLHCRAGMQRSAAVAAGVIAVREHVDILDALDTVRAHKPNAEPLPHQRLDLLKWWADRESLG
ncbi:MAG: dual specificity protein phosphatase family protein [Solirubrobacteraceae bacterium]